MQIIIFLDCQSFDDSGTFELEEVKNFIIWLETVMSRKAPSLVKLCAGTVIDNLKYVGDLSGIDLHLLKDILPHCTVDDLMRIEDATKDADLSPVTNDLWKGFYEQQFGEESMELVIRRMRQNKVVFKWRKLYEAKTKEREIFRNKSVERLRRRYEEELAKKQSRQIQICSKIPPSGSRRNFSSGSNSCKVSHIKGSLMKKARLEYLKSKEACIQATIRKTFEQRKSLQLQSSSHSSKPISCLGKNSASSSRLSKSFARR